MKSFCENARETQHIYVGGFHVARVSMLVAPSSVVPSVDIIQQHSAPLISKKNFF
jgi:hypothetical protein